jgi:dienelactone hydrolase
MTSISLQPARTLLAAILFAAASGVLGAEDLNLLPPGEGAGMLEAVLKREAFGALDRRKLAYEQVKTPEQIAAWQNERRDFFLRQLDGFPERTPLNAQVTGALDRGEYRIEKVIFESQPNHHVTALLYLPKTNAPCPGVLVPCGHSANGKAAEAYQRASILLAKNGLAVLCYDPIGQGERAQILKRDGKAAFNSTQEHTLVGIGSILLGTNTARHRIWDGMRALDYLASRPEVDPTRLGCTGNSGGGTLTSYLMALDDRIVAAAPSCYPTTFRELLEAAGPQDAEQNIFGQIAFGLDIPDYVLMRAPKPTLINAATLDQTFTIAGAWDLFRQGKRLYTRLGYANRIEFVEADAPHEFSTRLRVGATRWMRRWLLKIDDEIVEDPGAPILKDEEALCSPKGRVMLMPGERSVFELNAESESRLTAQRREFWSMTPRVEALEKVRLISGVRRLADLPAPKDRRLGTIQRAGYRIEKIVLEPEPGIQLPVLAFLPPKPDSDAYLYLSGKGKQADADAGGAIEQLVANGHVVLAVDLRGLGETENRGRKWYGGTFGQSAGEFYLAYLLGKSLVGLWAEDALVCGRFLRQFEVQGAPRKIHLIATGHAGVPALHAAALEPDLFTSVRLRETLASWAGLVRAPTAATHLITTVHGALKTYDLPDLVESIGAAKVTLEERVIATAGTDSGAVSGKRSGDLPLPADMAGWFEPPAEFANQFGTFRSPLSFANGIAVKTASDWSKRREEIRRRWHEIMGPWPDLISAPRIEFLASTRRENFTQHRIRIEIAPQQTSEGYLLVPEGKGKFPAVLVPFYDPETSVGLAKPNRDFAYQLTRRGFVTLSIGSPGGDARQPATGGAKCQPLSFLAYIASNCARALAHLPEVDPARIGIVGHSYGGKWAMFASCLDDGFACAAWSDPGIVFDEKRPNVNYWDPWYLGARDGTPRPTGLPSEQHPRTGAYAALVDQGLDLHELHALMAPRPFLVSGGSEDSPARWIALNHAIAVNRLLGFERRVAMTNRPKHDPTEESNEQIYRFFEHFLRPIRGGE